MRHPFLQRLLALLLLAGVGASLLPFGRDAVLRERWTEWMNSLAPDAHQEALDAAVSEVLAQVQPDAHALVQALVQRPDADPAWFGLDEFSPEAVQRITEHMAAVPVADGAGPAFVQGYASSPPTPSLNLGGAHPAPGGVLGQSSTPQGFVAVAGAAPLGEALLGNALSPRAP